MREICGYLSVHAILCRDGRSNGIASTRRGGAGPERGRCGGRVDTWSVSSYWTAGRIANWVHRTVLEPLGFTRHGRVCRRTDGGLRRTVTFTTETGVRPRVEMLVEVA